MPIRNTVQVCTDLEHDHIVRVSGAIRQWFDGEGRSLPWRVDGVDAWPILVSEVMLQQTPVARVLPVWEAWMSRWPTARDVAAAPLSEVITAWGRLGYPRRAKRLHDAARVVATDHDNSVPRTVEELRTLPGVGEYTAAAVAAFAYGAPTVVVDTNVRRVQARVFSGEERPAPTYSAAERALAEQLAHHIDPGRRPGWHLHLMELGALTCTARAPSCGACPLAGECAWNVAGRPPSVLPPPRGQKYYGTDRYVRGLVLAELRTAGAAVARQHVEGVWADRAQLQKALTTLADDGLIVLNDHAVALPD